MIIKLVVIKESFLETIKIFITLLVGLLGFAWVVFPTVIVMAKMPSNIWALTGGVLWMFFWSMFFFNYAFNSMVYGKYNETR